MLPQVNWSFMCASHRFVSVFKVCFESIEKIIEKGHHSNPLVLSLLPLWQPGWRVYLQFIVTFQKSLSDLAHTCMQTCAHTLRLGWRVFQSNPQLLNILRRNWWCNWKDIISSKHTSKQKLERNRRTGSHNTKRGFRPEDLLTDPSVLRKLSYCLIN